MEGKKTILVVDDDEHQRFLCQEILTDEGYDIVVAGDGKEALEKIEQKTPDLVILDIVMPAMGGSEVFRELRGLDPKVKVLLCSGYSIQGEADQLIGTGASGFIQKPFSLRSLGRSINDIVGPEA